jgi:hypothetical protein
MDTKYLNFSYPEEQIPVMVRKLYPQRAQKIMPLPLSRWR